MGRTSTARDRILESTRKLMLMRGYTGIGVAEICADAGVQKGSFYHFFDSKQALTLEAVDTHWADQRQDWVAALRGPEDPVQRLRALVDHLVESQRAAHASDGAIHGCMYGNLALELSGHDGPVQARLSSVFTDQTDLVATVVAEAQEKGLADESLPAADLAASLIAQVEGQVLLARVHDAPDLLDRTWPQVRRVLGLTEPALG